jgi:serine/threonine protein kinase
VETLGRYKLVKKIGAGGMAEVYLARAYGAQGIEKQLVIKRILPAYVRDAHFITMFVDEAQVASRLNHSNIVQIYSFEQIGRDYVLAMEYIDGADLTRLMVASRRGSFPIPPELAAFIIHEVARGLDYAHNRRDDHGEPLEIVHRDVSPQNILLSFDGAAKIADFGIARARQLGEEASGIIKGKFAYMSPEQAAGVEADRRSDIFSLGVVMFELLSGRALHKGKPGSEMLAGVVDGWRETLRYKTHHLFNGNGRA